MITHPLTSRAAALLRHKYWSMRLLNEADVSVSEVVRRHIQLIPLLV
jgi:hypothetical protein